MTIHQLSVFVENKSGTLLQVLELLKEAHIQLIASTISDTVEYGIYRIICSEPLRAYEVLKDGNAEPDFSKLLSVSQISDLARERWIVPRAERGEVDYRSWTRDDIPNLIKRKADLPTAAKHSRG